MDNEKLFAIKLADEDRKIREKCLVKIKNYITARSGTENGKNNLNLTFIAFT